MYITTGREPMITVYYWFLSVLFISTRVCCSVHTSFQIKYPVVVGGTRGLTFDGNILIAIYMCTCISVNLYKVVALGT